MKMKADMFCQILIPVFSQYFSKITYMILQSNLMHTFFQHIFPDVQIGSLLPLLCQHHKKCL